MIPALTLPGLPTRARLNRRRFLAGAAALSALPLLPTPARALAVPPSGVMAFDVFRSGDAIGEHILEFRTDGDRLAVDIAIDLRVTLAFIPVYRYRHRNREIWENGRLVSLTTETDDDGTAFAVRAEASADGLEVDGSEGRFLAPADTLSTSYWRADTVRQNQLLDTQHGRMVEIASQPVGEQVIAAGDRPVVAERFRTEGDLELDVWYSDVGQWVKLAFTTRGATIDYALRDGSAIVDG